MGQLDEIVNRLLQLEETTSDIAFKREIVKEYVYKASALLATGTKIFPEEFSDNIVFDVSFPGEVTGEFPVPEGSRAGRESVTWTPYKWYAKKAQASMMIT